MNDLSKHEQTTSTLRHYRSIEMGMDAAIGGDQEGVIH
jgi:hypothetical protein